MAEATQDTSNESQTPKVVTPQPSASIVLVDRSGAEPRVLLGRRNFSLAFLPGKYAFPGGRLEADDAAMSASGALDALSTARLLLQRPSPSPPPQAFALAAIRELFEETGLLLGTRSAASGSVPPVWQDFVAHGLMPHLAVLRFCARAITPPHFPRRFDTSFFLADGSAIADRIDGHIGEDKELIELAWLSRKEAEKRDISRITAMILSELETMMAASSLDRPVPFFHAREQCWIREEL
ncbi:MAG: NUDIX hydrolase [Methylovirgula sp.]|jgi:8-oxo-dGTP pyrophosphatase MutT (NUDIX family)